MMKRREGKEGRKSRRNLEPSSKSFVIQGGEKEGKKDSPAIATKKRKRKHGKKKKGKNKRSGLPALQGEGGEEKNRR